ASQPGTSSTGANLPGTSSTGASQPGTSSTGASQPGTSSTGSNQPVARFRRPVYIRWLKVGQGLQCCAEGLTDFCTDVIDNFHKSLKQLHGVCTSPSTAKNIVYDKKKKCWTVTCACGVCDRWFQSVKLEKAAAQFCWNNTNLQDWSLRPWQLAKVFMGQGQDPTSHDPVDTDPAGFLQLILNCKQFAGRVDATKVQALYNMNYHQCDSTYYCTERPT
ncbi:hypothetical protein LSAT2_023924, partial [Lamellibrachia satsuma]